MDLQIWRVTGHEIQSRLRFWEKKEVLFGGRECSYTQEGCLLSDHQILKSCQMDEFRYGLTEAGFHSSSGSGFQRVSHTLARSRLCEAERWDPPIPQVFALCVDVFHMRFMTCHQAKLVSNDVGKCLSTCTASATAVCTHVRYTSVNLLGSSEDSVPSNHEWSKALPSSWPRIVLQALFFYTQSNHASKSSKHSNLKQTSTTSLNLVTYFYQMANEWQCYCPTELLMHFHLFWGHLLCGWQNWPEDRKSLKLDSRWGVLHKTIGDHHGPSWTIQ